MTQTTQHRYRSTESKYKGGAHEMYVTYDMKQKTRGDHEALYPKVKRVYIAGDVTDWKQGEVQKRTGRKVSGVQVDYTQTRSGYHRQEFAAQRNHKSYHVKPAPVKSSSQKFRQIIEVPKAAQNIHFYSDAKKLPKKYQSALQNVR